MYKMVFQLLPLKSKGNYTPLADSLEEWLLPSDESGKGSKPLAGEPTDRAATPPAHNRPTAEATWS